MSGISEKEFNAILAQLKDTDKFVHELQHHKIPTDRYAITSVSQQSELFEFLSAADFGMLFREKDIINWVSRPTKMLEYQAVGLKIVHNNTVGALAPQELYKFIYHS